jgi:hypothetical protein
MRPSDILYTFLSFSKQYPTFLSYTLSAFYMSNPSHNPWFNHPNNIRWRVELTKLHTVQFTSASFYFLATGLIAQSLGPSSEDSMWNMCGLNTQRISCDKTLRCVDTYHSRINHYIIWTIIHWNKILPRSLVRKHNIKTCREVEE